MPPGIVGAHQQVMNLSRQVSFLALAGSLLGGPHPAFAAAASNTLRTFFEAHCTKCHGEKKQKGDLRLDTVGAPTLIGDPGETWLSILDALESGDMPPKKESRPSAGNVRAAISIITDALTNSAPPRPLALRRLNRKEYEHTVQDLLGIDTPLKDLLPEDSSVQGFDKVTDGLSISAVLMERYLEAADTAFDSVIRRIKPLPAATRRAVVMEGKENIASVKGKKGGTIEAEGSFVKFTPGWPPVRLDPVHPIEDGLYRCRIAVWPHDPGGRTLSVAVYVGPLFGPGKRPFMGMFDITGTPQQPRIIEFTTHINDGHAIHLEPWVYPEHVTWRDKDKEKRPGVAVVWAETYGPLDQSFPSIAQKRLFGDPASITLEEGTPLWMRHRRGVKLHKVTSSKPKEDAARIIRALVPRAFRRPVKDAVADPFVALTLDRLAQGRSFEQAVRAGVSAVLCAPQFLLLNRKSKVDDYTLASRLSYFLWSSMPDEKLLELAAAGKLHDPKELTTQVNRMIRDPRIERFVESFTGQWLGLREIEFTTPDKKLYPEFDPMLQESMLRETRGFFRHLLIRDLSVSNFIDSDFAILNERLANHYDIPGVVGHENLRVTALPMDSIRGGVLAQGSLLKITANGTNTSPVLRGVWFLENIMGQSTPPPPPGTPAVEPDIRGTTTIREQLAKHSSDPSCARCHARIDPPGFALEGFDPIGGERTWYRALGKGKRVPEKAYTIGPEVDASGPDFADFREFRAQLLKDKERLARTIAEKLLVYGTGRPLTVADRSTAISVVESAKKHDLGLRSMIHAVVQSELFRTP
jgi:cytochrome c553